MPTPTIPAPTGERGTFLAPPSFVAAAHEAIGRFIVEYAAAEVAIAATVEKFISTRLTSAGYTIARDITAMLVGSSRMEKAKELAKGLMIRADFDPADIQHVTATNAQLSSLQWFRNFIAHHEAHPYWYDQRWSIQTSNKYNVKDYSNER